MTTFWAGPSCTHMLAMLGAEVIHVESTRRPDGTRLIAGIPITEDQWWEKSPIFSGLNTNKKGLTLDLQSDAGRELLMRLIATCDVIVENFTPRVLDQIGLDFAAVQAVRPDAIMLRMPGFGLDGPWRDNPAFAYVIEAASGISWLTGYPDRNPVRAVLGRRSQRRCARAQRAAARAGAPPPHRRKACSSRRRWSTRRSTSPPNRSSSTRRTVRCCNATGTGGRRRRRKTCTAPTRSTSSAGATAGSPLPSPPTSSGTACATRSNGPNGRAEFATAEARRAHHDLIDEHLSAWCEQRTGDDIVEALWSRGVPVAKVMQPHRQTELPQLAARGFFEDVDHPVNARTPHSTLPFTSSRGPEKIHVQPAPLLGQHNHEVLSELGAERQGHRRTGGCGRDRHRTGHARHEGRIASKTWPSIRPTSCSPAASRS